MAYPTQSKFYASCRRCAASVRLTGYALFYRRLIVRIPLWRVVIFLIFGDPGRRLADARDDLVDGQVALVVVDQRQKVVGEALDRVHVARGPS